MQIERTFSRILPALAMAVMLPAHAGKPTFQDLHFSGSDRNWFNPANWSAHHVPGANDNVVLDGRDDVVIDPSQGPMPVRVHQLTVRARARLETLPGTRLIAGKERTEGRGQIVHRSSVASVTEVAIENLTVNPSTIDGRAMTISTDAHVEFGLGGREPARGAPVVLTGYGYYANLTSSDLQLGDSSPSGQLRQTFWDLSKGSIRITLHYGFKPVDGDQFEIVRGRRGLIGEPINVPQPLGCTEDNVGLYLGYDENALYLTAVDTDPATCLLPAVQKVR